MHPDTRSAEDFLQAKFFPEEAAEWYDTGATAAEATIFKQGGWNPATVTNWLQTNNLKYSDINKFIHTTISPALTVEWKKLGFSATEALQWAAIEIQVDLTRKLREMKVHLTKLAPPPNNLNNLSYSNRVKKDWKLNSTRRALSPLKRLSENT
ncbi:hypothetical protein DSO57_1020112 [Entomophthora muscae]|uniref:Uncharacterized protein n=1 Tax=Entomophthora muscae TaxID=34485 RepID=A0ACC2SSR2_9FUNG|nr:hypothetical protein DSO57_1020112 [Entomophthora muscae]